MIEHRAIQRFRGRGQAARCSAVRVAWSRISARVIVGQHDPGAAMQRGIGDDRPEREIRTSVITLVTRKVQAPRLVVDVRDPQTFSRGVGVDQAARKEAPSGVQSGKLQREFGTLIAHGQKIWPGISCRHPNRVRFGENNWSRTDGWCAPIGHFRRSG